MNSLMLTVESPALSVPLVSLVMKHEQVSSASSAFGSQVSLASFVQTQESPSVSGSQLSPLSRSPQAPMITESEKRRVRRSVERKDVFVIESS